MGHLEVHGRHYDCVYACLRLMWKHGVLDVLDLDMAKTIHPTSQRVEGKSAISAPIRSLKLHSESWVQIYRLKRKK